VVELAARGGTRLKQQAVGACYYNARHPGDMTECLVQSGLYTISPFTFVMVKLEGEQILDMFVIQFEN
jgi:hypothetical protein